MRPKLAIKAKLTGTRPRTGPTFATIDGAKSLDETHIGKVAAARELTELVFYGLRDGHIRRLSSTPA